ncbi:MAG TPA: hypothetical protein DCG49_12755 [Ruminococcus sp.]|nr:hypothetical protein [Ruminococcus sp.]
MKNLNMSSGLIMTIIGIILVLMPGTALATLLRFVGIVLIVYGVAKILSCLKDSSASQASFAGAIVAIIAGAAVLLFPGFIASVLPLFAAAVIIISGVSHLVKALEAKKSGDSSWIIMAALSVVTIIAGIFVFSNPISSIKNLVRICGVILIYNGLTGTWINAKQS